MEPIPPTPSFVMYGAREIISRTNGAVAITEQVAAIESGIASSPGIVFDLCRALVETTCKTILTERGISCESLKYNDLLKTTYSETSLVPERFADDSETAEKIKGLVAGFESVLICITHLRHKFGLCSHGKEASSRSLELAHALLAAQAADALVHFLYMAHKFFFAEIEERGLRWADNPEFNEYVDALHEPVEIFGIAYQPSDVLFATDKDAYRNFLSEFAE